MGLLFHFCTSKPQHERLFTGCGTEALHEEILEAAGMDDGLTSVMTRGLCSLHTCANGNTQAAVHFAPRLDWCRFTWHVDHPRLGIETYFDV